MSRATSLIAERRSPLYGLLTYHWRVPWTGEYASTAVREFYELAKASAAAFVKRESRNACAMNQMQRGGQS